MSPFVKLASGRKCPSTFEELTSEGSKVNCSGENAEYHCLRNKNGTLGTICVDPKMVQRGYCPVFNEEKRRIDFEKCTSKRDCSEEHFLSTEVVLHPECLGEKEPLPTTTVTPSPQGVTPALTIVLPVIVVIIVIIIATALCLKRRRRTEGSMRGLSANSRVMSMSEHERMIEGTDDPVQSTVEDETPAEISDFRDDIHYFKSNGDEKAENMLFAKRWIIVKGISGSGKTTLGRNLLSSYHNKIIEGRKCRARIIRNIAELDKLLINSKVTYILLLEDLCERWVYMPDIIRQDLEKLKCFYDDVMNVRHESRHVYCIFTLQSRIWELFKNKIEFHPLFDKYNVVDLQEEPFKLTKDELRTLLQRSVSAGHSGQGDDMDSETQVGESEKPDRFHQLAEALEKSKEIGAHEVVKIISEVEYFKNHEKAFAEKPEESIMEMFTEMCNFRRKQYFSLIYLLLKGGRISTMEDRDGTLLKKLADIDLKEGEGNLFRDMEETCLVLKRSDSSISFQHECILLYMFKHFHKHYPKTTGFETTKGIKDKIPPYFIENCEKSMLLRFVRTEDSLQKTDRFVIKTQSIKTLVRRLTEHCAESLDNSINHHVLMKDERFKKEFENERKQKRCQTPSVSC